MIGNKIPICSFGYVVPIKNKVEEIHEKKEKRSKKEC
jgi:hypothetical protein